MDDSGLDEWRSWNPTTQEKAFETLRAASDGTWKPFYCPRKECDGNHHIATDSPVCIDGYQHQWVKGNRGRWVCSTRTEDGTSCGVKGTPQDKWLWRHARGDQKPPKHNNWLVFAMIAGRGSGKTRASSEWVHRTAKRFPGCRIAIVAPTGDDFRNTNVEGESGLLATAPPGFMPEWEPSKKRLTYPNNSTVYGYSGEEPDRLRGKQHHFAVVDEPAHIPLIEDVWYNLLFGLRLGDSPKVFLTTSPKPVKWLVDLLKDSRTVVSNATTYANIRNLPSHYASTILGRYEGTRLGKQEIEGRLLRDVEGALWNTKMIDDGRTGEPPDYERVVVAIDPAGTSGIRSDETGIVVVARGFDGDYYVIADYSERYTPNEWAAKALYAYDHHQADALVPEVTYGREMVTSNLSGHCKSQGREMPRIITVDSRRGKVIRAEPVVGLYERGQVHHVAVLSELEDQITTWVPGNRSPDRLDALVHGLTELSKAGQAESSIASPFSSRRDAMDDVAMLQQLVAERSA